MGQKVNPTGFRLSVNRDWRSRWYASSQEFPAFLHSDLKIRNYVKKKLQFAAVSKIVIERAWNSIRVTIHTARPGIVIGRKGAEIEKMTEEISKMAEGKGQDRHPGNQKHRNSTYSSWRKRCAADRAANCLPTRDEKSRADRDGFRRGRNSAAVFRPAQWRGDFAFGMVPRRESSAAHLAHAD
jgi:hypothetical protein